MQGIACAEHTITIRVDAAAFASTRNNFRGRPYDQGTKLYRSNRRECMGCGQVFDA